MSQGGILTLDGQQYEVAKQEQEQAPQERELTTEEMDAAMPHPSGYHVLIALPEPEKKYQGSIIEKAEQTLSNEKVLSVIGLVVDMGPDAYADQTRFPSGKWCKPGDFVLIKPYDGTRFFVGSKEFRMINDDCVLGTVDDPRSYRRL